MIFSLAVYASPVSGETARTALNFCKAVLAAGHQVYRVFFFHEGVYNGSSQLTSNETDLPAAWQDLADTHQVDLVVCVTAALKRGVLDEGEARRHQLAPGGTLQSSFALSGLGQLVDATIHSDRVITFGS